MPPTNTIHIQHVTFEYVLKQYMTQGFKVANPLILNRKEHLKRLSTHLQHQAKRFYPSYEYTNQALMSTMRYNFYVYLCGSKSELAQKNMHYNVNGEWMVF